MIKDLTPFLIAGMGTLVAVMVILSDASDSKWTSAMGFAGSAVAAAAGLAQSGKKEDK